MKKLFLLSLASVSLLMPALAGATSTVDIDNWIVGGTKFDVTGRVIDGTIYPLLITAHTYSGIFASEKYLRNADNLVRHCQGSRAALGLPTDVCGTVSLGRTRG